MRSEFDIWTRHATPQTCLEILRRAAGKLSGYQIGRTLHRRGMAVQLASTYMHALEGRLRIKVSGVKGAPLRALAIEGELRAIDGVTRVQANPITGNILILYCPDRIGQDEVIAALHRLGCLQEPDRPQTMRGSYSDMLQGFGSMLAETLVRSTMELALQRLVSALI